MRRFEYSNHFRENFPDEMTLRVWCADARGCRGGWKHWRGEGGFVLCAGGQLAAGRTLREREL